MKRIAITAAIGALFMGGTAIAQQTTTATGGVTGAGRDGAVAGGVSVGQSVSQQRRNRNANRNRRNQQQEQMTVPSSTSTSTQGSVYTTRRSGAAAISTQGSASGPGTVSSSSEGDVYSRTDRTGSEADAYGRSDAQASEPRRPRPQ